ncbi:porin [Undibacterium sp. TJN25]|uniref:porin n=1 Tax=Undibacterium sp. TJN25 TaxID=3413056 RepID=UPI003BF2BD54
MQTLVICNAPPRSIASAFFLLAIVAPPLAHAAVDTVDSNIGIYGFLKVDAESVSGSSGHIGRVSNNLSVLGFRGKEDLGDGMEAFFQLESNVFVDTGTGGEFTRNTGVGLRGRYGQILGGIWESPYRFVSVYAIDPFTAGIFASNSILGNGFSTAGNGVAPASFDRRQKNLLQYFSPAWNGWNARIATSAREEKTAATNPGLVSALLTYEQGSLYLAYGYEQHTEYFAANTRDAGHKLGAAYNIGNTRLRFAWEKLRYEPTATTHLGRDAWQLAATHEIGVHIFRASYVRAMNASGNAAAGVGGTGKPGGESGARQYAVGYGYNLSKRTELWAAYTRINNDKYAVYNLSGNPVPGLAAGQDPSGFGLGITHKF